MDGKPIRSSPSSRHDLRTRQSAAATDQTREWIENRVLEPRRRGEPITLEGTTLAWDMIERIKITRSADPASSLAAQLRDRDRQAGIARPNALTAFGPNQRVRLPSGPTLAAR